jgi:hypothetical protein
MPTELSHRSRSFLVLSPSKNGNCSNYLRWTCWQSICFQLGIRSFYSNLAQSLWSSMLSQRNGDMFTPVPTLGTPGTDDVYIHTHVLVWRTLVHKATEIQTMAPREKDTDVITFKWMVRNLSQAFGSRYIASHQLITWHFTRIRAARDPPSPQKLGLQNSAMIAGRYILWWKQHHH